MLQTFHTPSFGDEEFDITPMGPTATPSTNTSHPPSYPHQVSIYISIFVLVI